VRWSLPAPADATIAAMERLDVRFPSGRDTCAAWLYLPDGDGPFAGVVFWARLDGCSRAAARRLR